MFRLEIKTDNAAFVEGYDEGEIGGYELARILREVADRVEPAYLSDGSQGVSRTRMGGTVVESNGNAVGSWEWTA